MKILVTGTAGFIGWHLANKLIERGDEVVGFDNINDYYDVEIKYSRLKVVGIDRADVEWNKLVKSSHHENYSFVRANLEDKSFIDKLFNEQKFDKVCNLAAQAGVRYSIENPYVYIESNVVGFLNILEACRHNNIKHLSYASSSSVYGLNEVMPLSEKDNVDHPISLYAATKKSNELMAHTYSHLYGIPTTGLRFFTVYGPWGRPDMALFLFTKAILENKPINVFNHGNMIRDFTYVSDIVEGIARVIDTPPDGNASWSGENPDPSNSISPYRIYNIGNNNPVKLIEFIEAIENKLGLKAEKILMEMQPGDVPSTSADVSLLESNLGYKPETKIEEGITKFIDWYRDYFKV